MSAAVFSLAVGFFTFGCLAIASLGFAALFSFGCQPTSITTVTLSAPAGAADIKNKMAPTAVDLT
jgi:hypothetical protein